MPIDINRVARECDVPHSRLIQYVNRGNNVTSQLAEPMASFGFKSVETILQNGYNGIKSFFDGKPLFIIEILLFLFLIYLLLLTIFSIIGFCSPRLAKFLGIFSCSPYNQRVSPDFKESRFIKKRKPLTFLFLNGSLLLLACSVALVYLSSGAVKEPENLKCNASRFQMEVHRGILYTQYTKETPWLPSLLPQVTYSGLDGFERVQDQVRELNTTTELYLNHLVSFYRSYRPALLDCKNSIEVIIKVKKTPDTPDFICTQQVLFDHFNTKSLSDSLESLDRRFDEFYINITGHREEFMISLNRWPESLADLKNIVGIVQNAIETYLNISPNIFYVVSIVFIIIFGGCILLVLATVWCFRSLRRYIKKQKNPDPVRYAKILGFFWLFFTIATVFTLIIVMMLLLFNSYGFATCSFIKSLPKNPSILKEYNLTRQFMDDPLREQLFERCVANSDTRSTFFHVFMPTIESYPEEVSALSTELMNDYLKPLFRVNLDLRYETIRMAQVLRSLTLVNMTHIFTSPNHFLIPNNFVVTTSPVDEDITIIPESTEYPPPFEDSFDKKLNISKQFHALLSEEDKARDCVDLKPIRGSDTSSINKQLRQLSTSLENCDGPLATKVNFCIVINGTSVCAHSREAEGIVFEILPDSVTSDVSNIAANDWSGFKGSPPLERILERCKNRITQQQPSCYIYYLNTIYVGVNLLSRMVSNKWSCEVDSTRVNNAYLLQAVGARMFKDYVGNTPMLDKNNDFLFHNMLKPNARDLINFSRNNCQSIIHSLGTVIDGMCGGLLQPYLLIFIVACIILFFLYIGQILTYRGYLYFIRSIPTRTTGQQVKRINDPNEWMDLIKNYSTDKKAMYKMMDESVVKPSGIVNDMDSNILHFATYMGDKATVEYLLNRGVDVNRANARGFTPLAIAVSEGHADIVEFLVRRGADPCIQDEFGDTPLHAAARSGDIACVQALCHPMAPPPTYRNNDAEYAVETAVKLGHHTVSDFLDPLTPRGGR